MEWGPSKKRRPGIAKDEAVNTAGEGTVEFYVKGYLAGS
jgi:hypothetical protein